MSREKRQPFIYPSTATEAAFLLGGIGTGNVSLGSRGEWRDWEIFNHPGKGVRLPNTFFAIWTQTSANVKVSKILEGPLSSPHSTSHGYHPNQSAPGLPRMQASYMRGEYPITRIEFEDQELPVQVTLEAFTPMIPLNTDDSSLPSAILEYHVENRSNEDVDVSIAGSLFNPIGEVEFDRFFNYKLKQGGMNVNQIRQSEQFQGLFMYSLSHDETSQFYGNLSLTSTNPNCSFKPVWFRGEWFDELQEFWSDFSSDGILNDLGYTTPSGKQVNGKMVDGFFHERPSDTGSLAVFESLKPGERKVIRFVLSWYVPNRLNGWNEENRVQVKGKETIRNYYATRFESSWDVAQYVHNHFDRLSRETRIFHNVLFSTTLPSEVIDAIASNMTALRSPTCFRLEDGRFMGYEGCFDDLGCCDGNCSHVWNYAQTVAFLYPDLEMSMRRTEFKDEIEADGYIPFRAMKMFGLQWVWKGKKAPAAVDGQLGSIMRVFREWKLGADPSFLEELWPSVKKALEFAFIQWDLDGDFVLEGEQHVTYDIEFYGVNPLCSFFLLGALRATEEMALAMNDKILAQKCRSMFEQSGQHIGKRLWNGEYFIQDLEDPNAYKYQHGTGCLSDQLFAQQLAHLYGLGYLLPNQDRIKHAIRNVYAYNFKRSFSQHENMQRVYVTGEESGLVLCSWPDGKRPEFPFVYSDEVWTGIEYQVAVHLIYEGFVDEGLELVRAVRARHDGFKRNPFNEVECGHHYARSMSSWGLLPALSGYEADIPNRSIRFNPVIHQENFTCFWSNHRAWGQFIQHYDKTTSAAACEVIVYGGSLEGISVYSGDLEVPVRYGN